MMSPPIRAAGSLLRTGDAEPSGATPHQVGDLAVHILKNTRVAVRLPIVVAMALTALIVFAVVAMNTLNTVKIGGPREQAISEQNVLLADILPPPAYLVETELAAMELRASAASGDDAGVSEARAEIEAGAAAFRDRHDFWDAGLEGEQLALMTTVRDTGLAYLDIVENELVPAVDAADAAAMDAAEARLDDQFTRHRQAVEDAAAQITATTATMTTAAIDTADGRQTMLWVVLVVTLLVVGAAATIVTASVLKPLGELRRNLDRIASDDDSSDARLDAERRDEFGNVAASFNTFADTLVASGARSAANARIAEARAVDVSDAAALAADNMNTVAVATTELAAAASEIARSAGDASRTAETAVRAADHANALMERLADTSARIGEVVESIRGIAAQTTMLALNATIEAARAGEAGRGFAVVASEVKDLAAETGTATADIVGRVDAIQTDTQAALLALAEVAHVISEISSSQSVIAAAVEEQAATTAEIDRSLTEAVTAINQLATSTHDQPADEHFTAAA